VFLSFGIPLAAQFVAKIGEWRTHGLDLGNTHIAAYSGQTTQVGVLLSIR
jgi:hypothetical protein